MAGIFLVSHSSLLGHTALVSPFSLLGHRHTTLTEHSSKWLLEKTPASSRLLLLVVTFLRGGTHIWEGRGWWSLLVGINQGFWCHLGCSWRKATFVSSQSMLGFTQRNNSNKTLLFQFLGSISAGLESGLLARAFLWKAVGNRAYSVLMTFYWSIKVRAAPWLVSWV